MATGALGDVEGTVGTTQQVDRAGISFRGRPTRADADHEVDTGNQYGVRPDHADQLSGDQGGSLVVGVRADDDELVATGSTDEITRANRGAESFGHGLEQFVASEVAVQVVGLFEPVNVNRHDREWTAVPDRPGPLGMETLLDSAAVADPGVVVHPSDPLKPLDLGGEVGNSKLQFAGHGAGEAEGVQQRHQGFDRLPGNPFEQPGFEVQPGTELFEGRVRLRWTVVGAHVVLCRVQESFPLGRKNGSLPESNVYTTVTRRIPCTPNCDLGSDAFTCEVTSGFRAAFLALDVRNYRLFFFGQVVSISGTWMQSVAQAWLVLQLTHSGGALGLVVALQTLPLLVGGAWGGVLADRLDKRRTLLATQSAAALLALALGLLTLTGAVTLWMVAGLAFGLGLVNAIDIPTRQAFVLEMVGRERLTNAVSLNGVVMNGGRIVGPALAGVLISTVGIAPCFLINSASYLAVLAGLAMIRSSDLHRGQPLARARGQLVAGLRYAWRTPSVRTPLIVMAVVGTFAYEFQVSLPLLAQYTFHTGAAGYGAMSAFMAAGAVLAGLVVAARARPTGRRLGVAAVAFGAFILVAALAPTLYAELMVLLAVGGASVYFAALANTSVQLAAAPEMRGRVMALYAVAFMGSTPVGGPIVGLVGEHFGARTALALGGLATVTVAVLAWRSLSRITPVDAASAPLAAA